MSLQANRVLQSSDVEEIRARNYQVEMLEQSVHRNVIIAMDTGSGKTEIAVMRIRMELDHCDDGKRVWFLAPTVALCEQQHRYIQTRLPDISPLILLGSSNIDCWSEQSTWDAALQNHRIVVSTHTVLLDALRHGFVKITELALLIFDEAHHCAGKHAANLIMKEFYHVEKKIRGPDQVPHILGLSASPVRRSNVKEIKQIEKNLDSVCVTPRIHRKEMLAHIHRPQLVKVQFSEDLQLESSPALCTLRHLHQQMTNDMDGLLSKVEPQVNSVRSPRAFEPSGMDRWKQIVKQYVSKSEAVYKQLGPWATNYFVQKTNELYAHSTQSSNSANYTNDKFLDHLLTRFFAQSGLEHMAASNSVDQSDALSDKANKLVDLLARQPTETTIGLIFVRERVVVSLLFHILSTHPRTAKRFQFATFVGLSRNSKRTIGIHELLDFDSQKTCLDAFRAKKKHIIIATDALEEGIDIAACNFVVCFDPPSNLKAFIQRRGRARKHHSCFTILEARSVSNTTKLNYWVQLEEEMISICQDEERLRQEVSLIENQDEHLDLVLSDPSTGAVLTADSFKAHLHHFCNTMPRQPFVETQPSFSIREDNSRLLVARVTLPNCVGSFRRSHSGSTGCRTERAAVKVAAFECYRAFHEAGLVNSNLLPSISTMQERGQNLPSLIEVDEQMQPWRQMARAWSSPELHKTAFQLQGKWFDGCSSPSISLLTPMAIPAIPSLALDQHAVVNMREMLVCKTGKTTNSIEDLGNQKQKLAAVMLPRDEQFSNERKLDFVYVFDFENVLEFLQHHTTVDTDQIASNLLQSENADNIRPSRIINEALAVPNSQSPSDGCGFSNEITVISQLTRMMSAIELHAGQVEEVPSRHKAPEIHDATREKLYVIISGIVGHVERFIVAAQLQTSLLLKCQFQNAIHIVSALTAPSVDPDLNFERYEFLGDAVLRMIVSAQVFVDRVSWPAGWLSQYRDNLVSNKSLANAALSLKLDQYILTKATRTRNWTLPRISEAERLPKKRALSSKTLADVLQALFAAAYLDSGHSLARSCTQVFLPEVRSERPVFQMPRGAHCARQEIKEAEQLIGYQFRNITVLLQALTHPSCASHGSEESYQRLAFLGNAVLGFVVTEALFRHHEELSEGRMTEIRAAVTNTNMLGYICMSHSSSREVFDIETVDPFRKIRRVETIQLWKCMRHESRDLVSAQMSCYKRHQRLRESVHDQLQKGHSYPWVALAKIKPEDFYSDLIQSVLGAIYVDSGEDWTACQHFVDTVGIKAYMERMIRADYDVAHPRSLLQQLAPSAEVHISHDSDGSFTGTVTVDGVEIENAIAKSCRSRKQALVLASHSAVQILVSKERG